MNLPSFAPAGLAAFLPSSIPGGLGLGLVVIGLLLLSAAAVYEFGFRRRVPWYDPETGRLRGWERFRCWARQVAAVLVVLGVFLLWLRPTPPPPPLGLVIAADADAPLDAALRESQGRMSGVRVQGAPRRMTIGRFVLEYPEGTPGARRAAEDAAAACEGLWEHRPDLEASPAAEGFRLMLPLMIRVSAGAAPIVAAVRRAFPRALVDEMALGDGESREAVIERDPSDPVAERVAQQLRATLPGRFEVRDRRGSLVRVRVPSGPPQPQPALVCELYRLGGEAEGKAEAMIRELETALPQVRFLVRTVGRVDEAPVIPGLLFAPTADEAGAAARQIVEVGRRHGYFAATGTGADVVEVESGRTNLAGILAAVGSGRVTVRLDQALYRELGDVQSLLERGLPGLDARVEPDDHASNNPAGLVRYPTGFRRYAERLGAIAANRLGLTGIAVAEAAGPGLVELALDLRTSVNDGWLRAADELSDLLEQRDPAARQRFQDGALASDAKLNLWLDAKACPHFRVVNRDASWLSRVAGPATIRFEIVRTRHEMDRLWVEREIRSLSFVSAGKLWQVTAADGSGREARGSPPVLIDIDLAWKPPAEQHAREVREQLRKWGALCRVARLECNLEEPTVLMPLAAGPEGELLATLLPTVMKPLLREPLRIAQSDQVNKPTLFLPGRPTVQ